MSAEGSTDEAFGDLTPVEIEAARGNLPDWSRASPSRRQHMARVAALMEEWAHQMGFGEPEALRWSATGWLHDALRDADPAVIVQLVDPHERDLPESILHGPAAAVRLRGQVDRRVTNAIRYHTLGHPSLDIMGRSLFLADFLEPGREFDQAWRGELRDRMPADRDSVLVEVLAARIRDLLDRREPIRPETAAFWATAVARDRP